MERAKITDQDGKEHEVYFKAVSYITVGGSRTAGKCYAIISNKKYKRIRYIDNDYAVKSTYDKKSFLYLEDGYGRKIKT